MSYLYVGLTCFVAGAVAYHVLASKIVNGIHQKLDALHVKADAITSGIGAALRK